MLDGRSCADRDEYVVGAAAAEQATHFVDDPWAVGPECVGRAKTLSGLELRVDEVERHDEARYPPGEKRGGIQREAFRNSHGLRGLHHDVLGERRGAQAVNQRLPVGPTQRALRIQRESRLAGDGSPLSAGDAPPAGSDQGDDDVIAGLEMTNTFSYLDDYAGRLVPVDRRQHPARAALRIRDVAVADRARGHLNLELSWAGRVQDDVLHDERFAERPTDGCTHVLVSLDTVGQASGWLPPGQ